MDYRSVLLQLLDPHIEYLLVVYQTDYLAEEVAQNFVALDVKLKLL